MDPLGIVLLSIALLLTALHLMTRRGVATVRKQERRRSLRFAWLALQSWDRHRHGDTPVERRALRDAYQLVADECQRTGTEPPAVLEAFRRSELPRRGARYDDLEEHSHADLCEASII